MKRALLDTETTGLPDDPDARVVEVACTVHDDDCPDLLEAMTAADENDRLETFVAHSQSWSSFVCPLVLTEAGLALSLRISGITEDEIRGAPHPGVVLDRLGVFLDGFTTGVRTWNLAFDMPMFRRTFYENLGLPDEVVWDGCAMLDFTHRWRSVAGINVETMEPRWISVKRAARLSRITYSDEQAHRASADTQLSSCIDYCSRKGITAPPVQNHPTRPIVLGSSGRKNPNSVKVGKIVLGAPKANRRDPRSVTTRKIVIGKR